MIKDFSSIDSTTDEGHLLVLALGLLMTHYTTLTPDDMIDFLYGKYRHSKL